MKYLSFIILSLVLLSGCFQQENTPPEAQNTNKPVNISVIDCRYCEGAQAAEQIKANALQDATINVIAQDSIEGKRLMEKFKPTTLPLFVLDAQAKNSAIKTFLPDIAIEKENEYQLLTEKVGLNTGKELLGDAPELRAFDYRTNGTAESPIQIVEYSDFECPFCKKFNDETYGKIKEKYGNQVSFVFKNMPLEFHKLAAKSAEAVQCAGAQNKFAEMHDKLFAISPKLEVENLKEAAADIGLDTEAFNQCLDSGTTKTEVATQMKDAESIGVTGTPAFVINGKTFVGGAYPFEFFESIIDNMLGMGQKL